MLAKQSRAIAVRLMTYALRVNPMIVAGRSINQKRTGGF